MRLNPNKWAEDLSGWMESRARLAAENRSQIFQILATLIALAICAGSVQYVPFIIDWLHVSDMLFGKVVVYSLPFWIAFVFFMIWRS
jgi:uncharacterized MAPEG superfamily protein